MNKIERMPLSTDLLRSFVTIAETGNLTLAAARLYRTQSAVSIQLRKLEEQLGAPMFERKPKGMELTEGGMRLLPRARRILADLQAASALFDAPLAGRLRLGIPDDYDDAILVGALSRFAKSHRGVDLSIRAECTAGYPADVAAGRLDLAVYSAPDNRTGRLLSEQATLWAASPNLQIDAQEPIPLAILERDCWWREAPIRALNACGRAFRVTFKTASFNGLKSALRAGLAIGILPATSFGPGLQRVGPSMNLPELPSARRSLITSKAAPDVLTQAMADAIVASIGEQGHG